MKAPSTSGSDAKRSDIVQNLTTLKTGTVVGESQFGQLMVATSALGLARGLGEAWERWNVRIVRRPYPCQDCKGSGSVMEWGRSSRTCNRCQGSGKA